MVTKVNSSLRDFAEQEVYVSSYATIQDAIDDAYTREIPRVIVDEDLALTTTINMKRGVDVEGYKDTRIIWTLPNNSTLPIVSMAANSNLSDLYLEINSVGYQGPGVEYLSEYLEATRVEAGGRSLGSSGIDYFQARSSNLRNLTIHLTTVIVSSTSAAITMLHNGLGISQWGHVIQDVRIYGIFYYGIAFINDQQYATGTPNVKSPWCNGCIVDNVNMDNVYNGFLFDARNTAGNAVEKPIGPSAHRISNVQVQAHSWSMYFAKLMCYRDIQFINCKPWDWDQPASPYTNNPYYITEPSDTSIIDNNRHVGLQIYGLSSKSDLEIDPAVSIRTTNRISLNVTTKEPSYGPATIQMPDIGAGLNTGNGTAGAYTYKDLLKLAPGIYTTNDAAHSTLLGLNPVGVSTSISVACIEVLGGFQGRRLFRAYQQTINNVGTPITQTDEACFYAFIATDATNFEGHAWLDDDIDPTFWRDANGLSPADTLSGTIFPVHTGKYVGQPYVWTTYAQTFYWNGSAWTTGILNRGPASRPTSAAHGTLNISAVGQGLEFYDAGLAAWVTSTRPPIGLTAARTTSPRVGEPFFDTTLGIPIWYDGSNWVNASGVTV